MDNLYQLGEPIPLQAQFKNAAGQLADPSSVTLEVRKPDGTVLTPTPTSSQTGIWTYTVPGATNNVAGLWWYAFIGTGTVSGTAQDTLIVEPRYTTQNPLSSRALISLQEARQYALGSQLDDSRDPQLIQRINDMSDAVYWYTHREWAPQGTTTATRRFRYRQGSMFLSFGQHDLVSATSITALTDYPTATQDVLVPGSTTVTGDYRLGPADGEPTGTYKWLELSNFWTTWVPQDFQGFEFAINGTWGVATIPDSVKLAVKIAVNESLDNPSGAQSVSVGPQTVELPPEEVIADAPWRALPAESRALLQPFVADAGLLLV